EETAPADSTPGKAARRSFRFLTKRCRFFASGYFAFGKDRSKASVCFGLKPRSVFSSEMKLRRNKPAPISKTSVNANSEITRKDCERFFEADSDPRSDSFRPRFRSGLLARNAGRIPNNRPQPHATRIENNRTFTSSAGRKT